MILKKNFHFTNFNPSVSDSKNTNNIKKELSPFSNPYIPSNTTTSTSSNTPSSLLLNKSPTSLPSSSTISPLSPSLPQNNTFSSPIQYSHHPQHHHYQQQQQQYSQNTSPTQFHHISHFTPAPSQPPSSISPLFHQSSSLPQQQQQQQQPSQQPQQHTTQGINTNTIVLKENIEHLFKNRFHPKNNIRETVHSSIQSILGGCSISENQTTEIIIPQQPTAKGTSQFIVWVQHNRDSNRPVSLPDDDNDSFYFRVLEYNFKLLTRIIQRVGGSTSPLQDQVKSHILDCYFESSKTTTDSNDDTNEEPSTPSNGILKSIIPIVLTSIAEIVSLVSIGTDNLNKILNELKSSNTAILESILHLLYSLLTSTDSKDNTIDNNFTLCKDIYRRLNLNHKTINDISLPYKLLLMRTPGQTVFTANHFKLILDWILGDSTIDITQFLRDQFSILNVINIISEKQRIEKKKFESLISTSSELLWFWATWECARYCIVNRLRSPYGNPVQTFERFEKILLHLNRERNDFKRIRITLQFMDSLEKQIFASANGSVLLPLPHVKEIQFFKHNVRVSEDWFSRIRMNLLKASILCSSAPDIIRHSSLRISDIRSHRFVIDVASAQYELEFCTIHMANALQLMNETETLQGLSFWIDSCFSNPKHQQGHPTLFPTPGSGKNSIQFSLSTPWMPGIIKRTKQKYEESLRILTPLLFNDQQPSSSTTTTPPPSQPSISQQFILEQIIRNYLDLSDYQELESFLLKRQQTMIDPIPIGKSTIFKDSYLKALTQFSKGDLEGSKLYVQDQLSTIDKQRKESIGLIGNFVLTDELLLAIKIDQKDSSSLSTISTTTTKLINSAKSCILGSLNIMGHESNFQTFQYLTNLKLLDEFENNLSTCDTKQVPINNQLNFLEKLRRVRNLIASSQHRTDLLFLNIPLTEKLLNLSRKHENFRLCDRLLNSILESHSSTYFLEKNKLKYLQGGNDPQKIQESYSDLLKYVNHFPEHITPAVKTKSYLEIVKYQIRHPSVLNQQQETPDYYFKKAVETTPKNPKVWLGYGDWASSEQIIDQNPSVKLDYIKTAVECYFQYLDWNADGSTIQVTLKILNLLVNYGTQLPECFEQSLQAMNSTKPFMSIIPQLFARLSHPEKFIQGIVINLINRIGVENPNKIVFPTIVGSLSGSGQPNHSQIQSIRKDLLKHSEQLVLETETLVKQLEKITILWDDSWQHLLEQIQGWLIFNTKAWNDEYLQIKQKYKKSTLHQQLRRKNQAMLQPILDKLKKLAFSTILSVCNTPHEKWFLKVYFETINKVIRNMEKNSKVTAPFDALHELIHCFAVNRLNSLGLGSINPTLAEFRPTTTQMPGLDTTVTIQSIQPIIYLLPTKTKPKKIAFVGNDGNTYSYLLKGREDLHLDQRIMQLLDIIDQMLMTNKKNSLRLLRTRNYAVVPLSQTSGLIQWVEGAVPLFSIYKNWYRNETLYKSQPSPQSPQQQQQQQQAPRVSVRPVEIFYSKLTPLFEEKGIPKTLSRSEWPKDLLIQVYQELMNETPRWLLSRELWYSSSSISELFLKTQSYSRSLALMSIIGYMIGLGDRHLDNILIDLKTGEIVHIDYNICFEKGLQLKVPERVPFRMTQIIEYALGLTGIQGTFSETCNHVLELLRNNKQTLLNLLETFIYDPLFDWKLIQKNTSSEAPIISKDNMNQGAGEQNDEDSTSTLKKKEQNEDTINLGNNNNSGDSGGESQELLEENESFTEENDSTDQQNDPPSTPTPTSKQIVVETKKDDLKSIQGLTVVNQVKLKLEGTEQKLSVPDQVNMVIREAMNIENLSVMYEGWSPWI
eukprot:gene8325-10225_t